MNTSSVCGTLKQRGGGTIKSIKNKLLAKRPIITLIVVLAIIVLMYANVLCCAILISFLVTFEVFNNNKQVIILNNKLSKNCFSFFTFLAIITSMLHPALAKIHEYLPTKAPNIPKSTVINVLEDAFKNYNASKFNTDTLGQRPCNIENRLTYILVSINAVEETNQNIELRYKNLITRNKNFNYNIDKLNKRAKRAKIDPSLMETPNIRKEAVNLKSPYERMSLWAKEIDRNINHSDCNESCSFNHIDTSSIKIVEEISNIQKQQDVINEKLTHLEQTFDKLEQTQRLKEHSLVAIGF